MKPTAKQKQKRIERTLELISEGHSIGSIRRTLKAEYGVSRRTADRYLSCAREEMLAEIDRPIPELLAESMAWHRNVITDADVPIKYRQAARKQLDKLLGLEQYVVKLAVSESLKAIERDADENEFREHCERDGIDPDDFIERLLWEVDERRQQKANGANRIEGIHAN